MSRLYEGRCSDYNDELEGQYTYVEYDSIQEFHSYMNKQGVAGRDNSSQQRGNSDWSGTDSLEEAISLMTKGDTDSHAKIKHMKTKTDAMFKDMHVDKPKMVNSVEGFQPIVANALLGLPNSMINIKKEPKKIKVIDIIYNSSIGAATDANDIILRGAYLLSTIEQLEKNGYRVNLYASKLSIYRDGITGHIVKIKDSMSPLNTLKVAFYLINPAYLRRIAFKIDEAEDRIQDCTNSGYGAATRFKETQEVVSKTFSNNDMLFFDRSVDVWSDNSDEENIAAIKELFNNKVQI